MVKLKPRGRMIKLPETKGTIQLTIDLLAHQMSQEEMKRANSRA